MTGGNTNHILTRTCLTCSSPTDSARLLWTCLAQLPRASLPRSSSSPAHLPRFASNLPSPTANHVFLPRCYASAAHEPRLAWTCLAQLPITCIPRSCLSPAHKGNKQSTNQSAQESISKAIMDLDNLVIRQPISHPISQSANSHCEINSLIKRARD